MGYFQTWYVPERIIYFQLMGIVQLETLIEGQRAFFDEVRLSKAAPVHLIFDMEDVHVKGMHLKDMKAVMHPSGLEDKLGWVLPLSQNPLVKFSVSVVSQMVVRHVRLRVGMTFEQAVRFLYDQDSSLGAPPPLPFVKPTALSIAPVPVTEPARGYNSSLEEA